MSRKTEPPSHLGNVLITGGCGFIGSHIVEAVLREQDRGQVYVTSRNPNQHLLPDVIYKAADLSNPANINTLISEINPKVIIHTASPNSSDASLSDQHFHEINVTGTANLLAAATVPSSTVKAFVVTSSIVVVANPPHHLVNETAPTWQPDDLRKEPNATAYYVSKAEGERLVLRANSPKLATASIRTCTNYGERDSQWLPGLLYSLDQGQSRRQIGRGSNHHDFVYAGNTAIAHVLAAKALLDPGLADGQVAGEAFHVTDGVSRRFWDVAHLTYRALGDTTDFEREVKVVPAWLMWQVATVLEFVWWVATWGRKRPPIINKAVMSSSTEDYTYDIGKARRVLGYAPRDELVGGMERAAEWELGKRRKEKERKKK